MILVNTFLDIKNSIWESINQLNLRIMGNNEFREDNNGIIYLSVVSYGLSGQEWIDFFDQEKVEISDLFKYSLNPEIFNYRIYLNPRFKKTKGIIYEIALLRPDLLFQRWQDRTTLNIQRKSYRFLDSRPNVIQNAEVFCLLSEKFSSKDFKKMGIKKIFGLTKSLSEIIEGTGDSPAQLFIMDFNRKQKRLDQDNDNFPFTHYKKGELFAFIVSETELSSLEPVF